MSDNDNDIATDCLPDLPPHGNGGYDEVVTGIATTRVATRRGWKEPSIKGRKTWGLHDDQPGQHEGPVAARVAMSDAVELHRCCSVLRLRLDDPHPWFSLIIEGEEHESICNDAHEGQMTSEEEVKDMTMSREAMTSQLPSSISFNAPSPDSPSSGLRSSSQLLQASDKQENEVGATSTDVATQAEPIAVDISDPSPAETPPSPVTHDRPYPTPQPSPTSTRTAEVDASHKCPTPALPISDPSQTASPLSTKHTPWPTSDPFLDHSNGNETPKAQRGRFQIGSPSSTSASGVPLKRSRPSVEESMRVLKRPFKPPTKVTKIVLPKRTEPQPQPKPVPQPVPSPRAPPTPTSTPAASRQFKPHHRSKPKQGANPDAALIAALETRLRTLKQAVKYHASNDDDRLESLITTWRNAGREVTERLFKIIPRPEEERKVGMGNFDWWEGDVGVSSEEKEMFRCMDGMGRIDGVDFDGGESLEEALGPGGRGGPRAGVRSAMDLEYGDVLEPQPEGWDMGKMLARLGVDPELLGWNAELEDWDEVE